MNRMRRLGQVLFFLALGIQFVSGAHILDHHQEWDRKCENRSIHFCNDVSTHDASSCAICLVFSGGLTFYASEVAESVEIPTAWVIAPGFTPDLIDETIFSSPRGPPSLPA